MRHRLLTPGERAMARTIYGDAIALDRIEIRLVKWWFLQPRNVVMAPRGHIHFHPGGSAHAEDFSRAPLALRGLLIHELCHVWQHQQGVVLPIRRHPFCRYDYALVPGRAFARYGIEQQAEIARHAWMLREGHAVPGKPPLAAYEAILPFGGAPTPPAAAPPADAA